MAKLLTYEKKDTWMDRLCGVTKLIYFLAWSITSMLTYDTRVLAVMLVLSLVLFRLSKTDMENKRSCRAADIRWCDSSFSNFIKTSCAISTVYINGL